MLASIRMPRNVFWLAVSVLSFLVAVGDARAQTDWKKDWERTLQ
jgi:hypothetical protein